jgi:hypothetical protein
VHGLDPCAHLSITCHEGLAVGLQAKLDAKLEVAEAEDVHMATEEVGGGAQHEVRGNSCAGKLGGSYCVRLIVVQLQRAWVS